VTSFTVVGGGIFPHEVYFSGHDHFNGRWGLSTLYAKQDGFDVMSLAMTIRWWVCLFPF
jgi:hypothetical protein